MEESSPKDFEIRKDYFSIQGNIEEVEDSLRLDLSISMEPFKAYFKSRRMFNGITEKELMEASDNIKKALMKTIEQFHENLDSKMASYGLDKEIY